MTQKRCAYKGCGLFTSPTNPRIETFYAFPKDPERCKLWIELAKCAPNLPFTSRYLCSNHFDESKYVAHNQRRKQLLSTAVPYPYRPKRVNSKSNNMYVVTTLDESDQTVDDYQEIDSYHEAVVEVSNDIEESIEVDELENYKYDEEVEVSETQKPQKRKLEAITNEITPRTQVFESELPTKRIATLIHPTSTISSPEEEHKVESLEGEVENTQFIESNNLTTFIFKGEEYVQLPKSDYDGQIVALKSKIKMYEYILKDIRSMIDSTVI